MNMVSYCFWLIYSAVKRKWRYGNLHLHHESHRWPRRPSLEIKNPPSETHSCVEWEGFDLVTWSPFSKSEKSSTGDGSSSCIEIVERVSRALDLGTSVSPGDCMVVDR